MVCMTDSQKREYRIVDSQGIYQPTEPEAVSGAERFRPKAEAIEVVEALKNIEGVSAVFSELPLLERFEFWGRTAFFSLSELAGTARRLKVAGEPGVYVNFNGGIIFGVFAPPESSRVECIFDAPAQGAYSLNARLVNFAGPIPGRVECSIDGESFGQFDISLGLTDLPLVARLRKGPHVFQVKESEGGPIIFLSLTVWSIPVFAP